MDGAFLGDIAGSRYEFSKPKRSSYETIPLFESDCFYTSSIVMMVATKYALFNGIPYRDACVMFGKHYPYVGYGSIFKERIHNHLHSSHHSYGSGSVMQVGFVGEYFETLEEVECEAKRSAECSHSHLKGITGAQAVAVSVLLVRNGFSKHEIKKQIISRYGHSLNRCPLLHQSSSRLGMSCKGSVLLTIRCFLENDSWESSIRNVLSVTCDTDTVVCIMGTIAEAYYKDTGFDSARLLRGYLFDPAVSDEEQLSYRWVTAEENKEDRERLSTPTSL